MKTAESEYTCEDARRDIDFYFENRKPTKNGSELADADSAHTRALTHIRVGWTAGGKRFLVCQACWDYYNNQKERHPVI